MGANWWPKSCPRCRGDVYVERDHSHVVLTCIQCGCDVGHGTYFAEASGAALRNELTDARHRFSGAREDPRAAIRC